MRKGDLSKPLLAIAISILYAGIYRLFQSSGLYHHLISFNPWLFYPPAFVRLAAFLLIDFWAIPALFLAGLCCIDFGMSTAGIAIVSAFCAVGGPLGTDIAAKFVTLNSDLSNLTSLRLLALSLGCAVGNAAFLKMGLLAARYQPSSLYASMADPTGPNYIAIVIGDTIGTWVMIYLIKTVLTLYDKSLWR
ncbi:MAG: hypothetical protein RIQ99_637 [Pseudomonadota bacterium]|jgi:hypothetical protein